MSKQGLALRMIDSFFVDGNKDAFLKYDGDSLRGITYEEFGNDILKMASYLKKINIRNQHVGMLISDPYKWSVSFLAIIATNNVAVALQYLLPEELLEWQCQKADVDLILTENASNPDVCTQITKQKCINIDELVLDELISSDEIYSAKPQETIMLLFTSGTTGKSKAVEVTDEMLRRTVEDEPLYGDRSKIYFNPAMFHIGGIKCVLMHLRIHKTVCIGRGARYFFQDLPKLNPALVFGVPAVLETVVKLLKRTDKESVREELIGKNLQGFAMAGAKMDSDIIAYVVNEGFFVEIDYGMTESTANGMRAVLDKNSKRLDTVGRVHGGIVCKICDGEILFKGPSVMSRYYKDPEETDKIIKDGWLYTGDLGYCDEEGFYYITGRKKNIIILANGENVSPEEIEQELMACEDIIECRVYDDGKKICVDIFTEDEKRAREFVAQYNAVMPLYRKIYQINCQDMPLEKTSSGKIKR